MFYFALCIVCRSDAIGLSIQKYVHYRSKVWGHPDNFMFSMKTHTFIHQMSCKINRKYSQDIEEVRNKIKNNFVLQTLLSSKNSPFAAITALQTFGILAVNLLR